MRHSFTQIVEKPTLKVETRRRRNALNNDKRKKLENCEERKRWMKWDWKTSKTEYEDENKGE